MHPINGYLLGQLNFKAADLVEISQILTQINGTLNRLGLDSLPLNDLTESVIKVSVQNLNQIPQLRTLMVDLSLVHPKVELSTEYKQLQELVEIKAPQLINHISQIIQKTESQCRKLFTQAADDFERKAVNLSYSLNKVEKAKHQKKLEQYISFSDFKPLLDQIMGEQNSVAHFLNLESTPELVAQMFLKLKQQVMSQKANIPNLIAQFGQEIPVEEIKDLDPIAYEYLRSLAFQEVARNNFNLEIRNDKTLEQRVIRPADPLAAMLKISPVQMAIFALSLDPIRSFGLAKGQKIESSQNSNLKFVVLNDQEQRVINQKIKVNLGSDQVAYVITPIYVSYVKYELDKNLQSSSIKYA